jgi:Zn-dependent M28 family amino/carboxypeptidase
MKRLYMILPMFFSLLIAGNLEFDAYRAFSYLEKQVKMGPRIPGSKGQIICRDWIIEQISDYADTVIVQSFKAYRPDNKTTVDAYNIIARINKNNPKRVMLSTHWDTRPISDKDFVYYNTPVPGANDGASGTAVLIELIQHVKKINPTLGIDIVFWDAEDMGIAGNGKYFCQGSEYYANNLIFPKPQKGILIDMIGDHDLVLPIEANSLKYAPSLVSEVWAIARELGLANVFQQRVETEIFDDHIPLNVIAGIPTIDIIDFNYSYQGRNLWHTPRDLPAYCSPQSLQTIGHVLSIWLSRQ